MLSLSTVDYNNDDGLSLLTGRHDDFEKLKGVQNMAVAATTTIDDKTNAYAYSCQTNNIIITKDVSMLFVCLLPLVDCTSVSTTDDEEIPFPLTRVCNLPE